ncbi:hypothetical protein [Streptomyces sp. CEV 2-1]|uniref:hypothetical protein n=1 Tax=Streptomyces sp. CEV 2-1 TaxID=2485153 RepID=UPI0011CD662B|nr:hypothetical protein [Streptomyces sp. CEV 2-1]
MIRKATGSSSSGTTPLLSKLVDLCVQPAHIAVRPGERFSEGSQWLDGDQMFCAQHRDAVPEDEWAPVWTIMHTLAEQHGDDEVRLVVWFDD